MKKILSNRRNTLVSGRLLGASAGVLAFAVLVVLIRLLFPNVLFTVFAPLWRVGNGVAQTTDGFLSAFDSSAQLAAQLRTARSENDTLSSQNAVLTAKVADLTRLLGSGAPQTPGITAGVLARPPEVPYDTFIVSAGTSGGVALGDIAYASGGVRVGMVSAAGVNYSRITLLSAGGESTNAWIGEKRVPARIVGEGGGAFTALLPQSSGVAEGDAVYVAGPGALPIGTVKKIQSEASSPEELLSIASSVNLFEQTWVLLVHAGSASWPLGAPVATSTQP